MTFDHEGKTFELSITRAGVRAAEKQGMTMDMLSSQPTSAVYLLFFSALYSRYKFNPNKTDAMLDTAFENGELEFSTLYEGLVEQYMELFGMGESE